MCSSEMGKRQMDTGWQMSAIVEEHCMEHSCMF